MSYYLLVNPWITDFKCYDEWIQPLGLFSLAHYFIENHRKVKYLDFLGPHRTAKRFGTGDYYAARISKPEIYKNIPRYYKRYGIQGTGVAFVQS